MLNFFKKTALTRTIFFALADVLIVVFSAWLAFFLRFDGNIPSQYFLSIYRMIFLLVIFLLPFFYFFKLYSFSWAYVSINEAVTLFFAATASFIFFGAVVFLFRKPLHFVDFPRSTIFITYILVFVLCGFLRLSKRIYFGLAKAGGEFNRPKTLIVGAGDAGEQILRSIIHSFAPYNLCGFVDDNSLKQGVVIHGLKVLGKISDIPEVAQKYQIKQLIIALPSADSRKIKEAVDLGKKAGILKIKITPPLSEIIKGEVSFKNLKNVEVEDLLGRERIFLDTKQIENFISGKSVLVTGAAGSIGSELSRQVSKFKPKILILLDQDETGIFNISKELEKNFSSINICTVIADIAEREKINKIFEKLRPQIVFHAAAYKHVPLMEENPDEAVKNNIFGTKNLAEAGVEFGTEKFIFISTDKAVNPSSVMGATKRAGEMVCQMANKTGGTKFVSVRFGNVLNSRGSVIPIFREQIRRGEPIEVTHPEMKRYFMLTSEACLLLLQAGAMGRGGEVFVLDMGKPVKIVDLAKEMIKLSGLVLDRDIAIVFTKPRPGEKLFEEILTAEEGTMATQNQKIFTAKLSDSNLGGLNEKLDDLKKALAGQEKNAIIAVLEKIVPSSDLKGQKS